jgi:iron(III) transport system ATP-binding protein
LTYRSASATHHAVKSLSLEIKEGEFFTLLGPSGCGKTTTLRCVAGLERPDSGEIVIGNQIVYSSERRIWVPPHSRDIGMVFQSYAIWPHMNVFDNVAFPLRQRSPKPPKSEIRDRVVNALSLVQMAGFEERPAPFLSGGQQQRLALARALVSEPQVLLLDEPLSNLDAKLREEMRLEIRQVVERLKVTTLFVTHEQIEALTMSDNIAVMNEGVIVQQGKPIQIYDKPVDAFVADFIGKTNMLSGKIASVEESGSQRIASIETSLGTLRCVMDADMSPGSVVQLTVRPEKISIVASPCVAGHQYNYLNGKIEAVSFLGNLLDCTVAVGPERLRVQLSTSIPPESNAVVYLLLPVEHCQIVPAART